MKLFINNTPVDVTPQNSDTIQTLIKTISKELEADLVITELIIDGTYQSIDDPNVLSILINSIQKVELVISSRIDIATSLLEDCKNFMIFGAQELKNGSLTKKNELVNTFSWIIDCLDALNQSLPFPPIDISILRAIIIDIIKKIDENTFSLEEMDELAENLKKIAANFAILQKKILAQNDYSKESTFTKLKDVQKIIPDITMNFQTGNDLKAIQQLCVVIDMIEMFVRYAASNSTDSSLEQHALSLKDLSIALLKAFENKDFTLITDLIEYDLNENIDNILDLN